MALIEGVLVPVPADGRVYDSGVVYLVKPAGEGERWPHKTRIGKIPKDAPEKYISKDGLQLMIPNDKYRLKYKDEYEKYLHECGIDKTECFPPESISVGLYLLVLGVANKLGVYKLLCEIFNATLANAIMDLSLYYILCSDNAINKMESKMNDQLMFSICSHKKDWYTKTFGKFAIKYNPKAVFGDHSVREFMHRWLEMRIQAGLESTYLSLDGTNFDCQSAYNEEAEKGHAKTGKKVNIVGVMAAIEASGDNRGMPLAYTINPGSRPDVATAQDLLAFFIGTGIKVKALLADRGFTYDDVMKLSDKLGMPFLMMLKTTYEAFTTMFEEFKDVIFWNQDYWIEGNTNFFGISKTDVHLFSKNSKNPDRTACVALFFDGTKSSIREARDKKKMNVELRRIRRLLDKFNKSGKVKEVLSFEAGKESIDANLTDSDKVFAALEAENIKVSSSYEDIIEIEYEIEAGKVVATVNRDMLEETYETFGYSCMASSEPKTAQEMADEYMLRDYAEKAFSAMKTELGFTTNRTKGSRRFHAKFFTCYIADIIRNEIVRVFQVYEEKNDCSIDTNVFISEFSRIDYIRSGSGYEYSGQTTTAQREILESLGISYDALKELGPLISARIKGTDLDRLRSEQRIIPAVPAPKRIGRPKGSSNKQKDDSKSNSKTSRKGKQSKKATGDASHSDSNNCKVDNKDIIGSTNIIDGANKTEKNTINENIDSADSKIDDHPGRITTELDYINPEVQTFDTTHFSDSESDGLKSVGASKTAEQERAETNEIAHIIAEGLLPEEPTHAETAERETIACETRHLSGNKASDDQQGKRMNPTRTGMQYKNTLWQDEQDRKLSEATGIDIIGNPPPRPWTAAFRAAETRRRNRLRKEAQKKLWAIRAAASPEPDQ